MCLEGLANQFPTSPRTFALLGMQFEAEEKLDQAQKYYDHVLKEDETNLVNHQTSPLCRGNSG
jgi:hypothetical protein